MLSGTFWRSGRGGEALLGGAKWVVVWGPGLPWTTALFATERLGPPVGGLVVTRRVVEDEGLRDLGR